MMARQTDKCF